MSSSQLTHFFKGVAQPPTRYGQSAFIVSVLIKHGDFPWFFVCLPEGRLIVIPSGVIKHGPNYEGFDRSENHPSNDGPVGPARHG